VPLDDGPVDWLVLGEDELFAERQPFAAFVAEHGDALLRFAAAAAPTAGHAPGMVARALATAYRRWRDIGESEERPLVEVAGLIARRIARLQEHEEEAAAYVRAWRAGRSGLDALRHRDVDEDPMAARVRSALDRMRPQDRLAGALHEILGLDEHEVGAALRIPWLHAVARIARAEVRGPELLEQAGMVASLSDGFDLLATTAAPVPTHLAAHARRRGRTAAVIAGGVVALSLGLGALLLPDLSTPARTPAPATTGLLGAAGGLSAGHAPAGTGSARLPCPAFPPETERPVYMGPPVPASALLQPSDFAPPGTSWSRFRDPFLPRLPTALVEGADPVLPVSQVSGIADSLVSLGDSSSTVDQLVVRYDRGSGALASVRIARQLQCHDAQHAATLLDRQDVGNRTIRAYAMVQLAAAPGRTGGTRPTRQIDGWHILVRSGDLVSVLTVRGEMAQHASREASVVIAGAVLDRLEGRREPLE